MSVRRFGTSLGVLASVATLAGCSFFLDSSGDFVGDSVGDASSLPDQETADTNEPSQLPVAAFAVTLNGLLGAFDASTSSSSTGELVSFTWDFGDGTIGTGAVVQHAFAADGTYLVRLLIADTTNQTASTTQEISVTAASALPYASDSFSRSVAMGIGTADVGGDWTLTGLVNDYKVDKGVASIALAKGTGRQMMLAIPKADVDVTLDFTVDKIGGGNGTYLYTILRQIGPGLNGVAYRGKIRIDSLGVINSDLTYTVGSADTDITTYVALGKYTPASVIRARYQCTGTNPTRLRQKVWVLPSTEPADWLQETTATQSDVQMEGIFGVSPYLSGSSSVDVVVTVDNFLVTPPKP